MSKMNEDELVEALAIKLRAEYCKFFPQEEGFPPPERVGRIEAYRLAAREALRQMRWAYARGRYGSDPKDWTLPGQEPLQAPDLAPDDWKP